MIVRESIGDILKPKSEEEIEDSLKNMSDRELIEMGFSNKNAEILEYALTRELSPKLNGEILKWSSKEGNINLAKKALQKNIDPNQILSALSKAMLKNGDIFEILIEDKRFDPSLSHNRLIRWAASEGHYDFVKMLLDDPRVDPSDLDNAALKGALVYNHKQIANLLLQHPKVQEKLNPEEMKEYGLNEQEEHHNSLGNILKPKSPEDVKKAALAIENPDELLRIAVTKIGDPTIVKSAIERGADPNKISSDVQKVSDPEIIKILLTNPKTNISPNSLVYKAAKLGLEDELIQLVKKGKLNPGLKNSILLVWAVGFGRSKLAEALLKDKRVEPESEKESIAEALSIAIARGNNELVKTLLKDPRIDPSGDFNRPIKVAAQFGNIEAVKALLDDDRVDPTAGDNSDVEKSNNFAVKTAAENGHHEIVKLLLQNKEVLNKLNKDELKRFTEMAKIVKESLIEQVETMAQPTTKPTTKPGVKPGVKPGSPNPIRRERPSVTPRPKATADDIAKKFLDLVGEE